MSVSLPTSTSAFDGDVLWRTPRHPGLPLRQPRAPDGHPLSPVRTRRLGRTTRQASGRRGIRRGGSAYGCCFTGGAVNNLFTFASLTKASGRGVLSALSPFVVVTWVAGKNVALTVREVAKEWPRLIADRGQAERGWRWLK